MPIELTCTGCAQTLRVGDEHAGKKARCPGCGMISTVPMAGESPPPSPSDASPFDMGEPAAEPASPYSDLPEPSPSPYQTPSRPVGVTPSRHFRAHRGGLILTFGILGLTCCVLFFLGIAAWIMGSSDLREMRAGRMDPTGQGMTQAGMILGIITTIFSIVSFLFFAFAMAAGGF